MHNRPPPGLWDSFWAEHASSDRLFHRLLWRIRFLFSHAYARALYQMPRPAPNAARILEVGCGSARTLHYLGARLPDYRGYAFDLSPDALRVVKQISPNFRATISEASRIPLANASCTLAFSIGLIEHFDRPTAAEMVRDMARVTEPGGVVAVMVPWRSSLYNLIRIVFGQYWPFGAENPFRRGELVRLMRAQGLRDVRLHIIYFSTLLVIGRTPEG